MPESKPVPDIVIGRLPIYLRALTHMLEEGKQITA
ncbi:MAG: winged-helix domain-containing protein, partial [Anaerolineae bacterium]